jgi:glycine hydroxymethyltransferase
VLDLLEKISSSQYHEGILNALKVQDRQIYELIRKEYERLQNSLQLVAAENRCSGAVLAALGSVVQNKTVYGFPGAREHGGSEVVDDIERLAVARAKEAFGARYANVQPHSGTSANQIILTAMLGRGDKILSLGLGQGGHLSHGASVSFSGKFFNTENYYVDKETFLLDYEAISRRAREFRPKLIICGASAYSRTIDFKRFREIADSVGAYLLADISHISGLILAGAHPSCVDYAHFTTTSTYKPGGPRGGLILMGRDCDRMVKVGDKDIALWEHIEKATFPGVQGTPYLNNITAKAVFLKETLSDEYRNRQCGVIANAKKLAEGLLGLGFDVLTGGTDNHMVLVNVSSLRHGLTGLTAQKCLEQCGITVDKNRLPYDNNDASITSGIRLGTPIVTKNGMGPEEMDRITVLIDAVLKSVNIISNGQYELKKSFRDNIKDKVKQLCHRFPIH